MLVKPQEHVPGPGPPEQDPLHAVHHRALPARLARARARASTSTQVQRLEPIRPKQGGVLGFLNLFSGGALTRFAVFGLGIMPYITSSIIMQLLEVVIPKLEQWREQGAVGQRKITQTTRYLTVALAIMQSTGLAFVFHNGGRASSARTAERPRPDPQLHRAPRAAHRAHDDRRHRHGHVAGRAHHPARHRPGHVDPDLRQRRVRPARAAAPRSGPRAATSSSPSSSLLTLAAAGGDRRSSSRASAASRCSSPSGSSAGACTAARAPTSRSRSTSRASSRSSSPARCCTSRCCCRTWSPWDGRCSSSSTTTSLKPDRPRSTSCSTAC